MTIDKSVSKYWGYQGYNKRSLKLRLDNVNIVEHDHRFIKWRKQNSLGFKSFKLAKRILNGIKVVHMLRKTDD